MREKKPLNVAFVGCGLIGQWHHIPSLLRIRDAKVVAICDVNENLAKATAQKFNISRYYTDFSEMLTREKVNMVDICTPPQTHPAFSIQAMDAGCHVLVEKPMALNLKEVDEMLSASEVNHVKLCVIHNKLFEPVMMKARAMVSRDTIGSLMGIDIKELSRSDTRLLVNKDHWCNKLPGGVFSETIPHAIYLAAAFLGHLTPVAVHSRKSSSYEWVVADELRVILKGGNGMGTITYGCNSPKDKVIIDIFGTKRHLRIDLWNSVITEYGIGTGSRPSRALENLSQSFSILGSSIFTTLSVISGKFHSGHYTLVKRFIESIQNDTEPPVTLQEARHVVEMMEKIIAQI